MARVLACDSANLEEYGEVLALLEKRQISSRSARMMFGAASIEIRILAVRKMRDERDVYRVAKTAPDEPVRKEAILRLRFVLSLKRLLRTEKNPDLRRLIEERRSWLAKQEAEVLARARAGQEMLRRAFPHS